MQKKTGLGRGLDALIDTSHVDTVGASSINEVEIAKIVANPNQPRRTFDEEALEELAASIREHGVISPITLRKNDDDTYMIIAGERRYRAGKLAGLTTIPAYIRTAKDEQVMEWALVENIQRENLDAIEIALAYQRLMDEYQLTQERLSERVGKKRTTVANYLRLLKLPAEIQMGIKEKKIEMGHARAILAAKSAETQLDLYKRILSKGLSVRQVEEMAGAADKSQANTADASVSKAATPALGEEFRKAEERLTKLLGTACTIKPGAKGKGKLVIAFGSAEELQDIMEHFK
ncbi:MAG: ParB/RepB/Spo0J family partition protein [Paludibacteraceae bacterium]|nr:ParB/RepB/Spo0J family partition protein [Paludibacteraceae bacterium]